MPLMAQNQLKTLPYLKTPSYLETVQPKNREKSVKKGSFLVFLPFYSSSCSFPSRINSRTRGPPFAPPLRPASATVILPFSISISSCRLLDKTVHLHPGEPWGLETHAISTNEFFLNVCGCSCAITPVLF